MLRQSSKLSGEYLRQVQTTHRLGTGAASGPALQQACIKCNCVWFWSRWATETSDDRTQTCRKPTRFSLLQCKVSGCKVVPGMRRIRGERRAFEALEGSFRLQQQTEGLAGPQPSLVGSLVHRRRHDLRLRALRNDLPALMVHAQQRFACNVVVVQLQPHADLHPTCPPVRNLPPAKHAQLTPFAC